VAFSIFATYLAFIVESSIFSINQLVQEQRTYFPYIFIFLGLATYTSSQSEKIKKWIKNIIIILCIIFIVINMDRNREINTADKWFNNTVDYYFKDQKNNLAAFEYYHRSNEVGAGLKFAIKLSKYDPNNSAYTLWLKRFEYDGISKNEKIKSLVYMANQLAHPDKLNMFTRHESRNYLNQFVLTRLFSSDDGLAMGEIKRSLMTEKLITPQLNFFINNMWYYLDLIEVYYKSLHILKKHYEQR
jgi:hypothetical protein